MIFYSKISFLCLCIAFFQPRLLMAQKFSSKAIQLSPEDYLKKLASTPDRYLIDVRTAGEHKKTWMKGSLNFSLLDFNFGKKVRNLERSKPVFLYCETAHRSPFAARKLHKLGFKEIIDLRKGFQNWRKSGFPHEKLNQKPD